MEISRFPNKLRAYRRISGYSQKKVARMLGLGDTSTLSRWENGLALPGIVQVFRLARIYNSTPFELYANLWQQVQSEFPLLSEDDEPFISNEPLYV